MKNEKCLDRLLFRRKNEMIICARSDANSNSTDEENNAASSLEPSHFHPTTQFILKDTLVIKYTPTRIEHDRESVSTKTRRC